MIVTIEFHMKLGYIAQVFGRPVAMSIGGTVAVLVMVGSQGSEDINY
jgi:hypothetical protein